MKLTVRAPARIFSLLFLLLLSCSVSADIRVAVASNFLIPVKQIAKAYEKESGDKLIISAGSTGKLYAQIINGAPFDVFLAANSREPQRLEKEGYALNGSRFTYARGKLVLWEPKGIHQQSTLEEVLEAEDYKRLSMANPLTAPYGAAAMSVLQNLKLDKRIRGKLLRGENVSQAYRFVASGAVDLGFVALSQLKNNGAKQQGVIWIIDEAMHTPILQQAVLLKSARQTAKAQSFLAYLKSSKGRAMIESFGYGLIRI